LANIIVLKRIGHEFEIDVALSNVNHSGKHCSHDEPSAINPYHNPYIPEKSSATYRYKYERPEFLKRAKQSTRSDVKSQKAPIVSSDWVLYALIDSVVDLYMPLCESLAQEVDTIDELMIRIDTSEHKDVMRRIGLTNRNIIELRRLIQPKEQIVRFILTTTSSLIGKHVKTYMRDVLDHILSCIEKLEHSKDTLTQTHTSYLTRIQVSVAKTSRNRTDIMNNIGIVSFMLGPLSIIPTIIGMNVPIPGGDGLQPAWFAGIMALLVLLCVVTAIITRINI
jgi:Mg2+ and Co2+ transporter CorA